MLCWRRSSTYESIFGATRNPWNLLVRYDTAGRCALPAQPSRVQRVEQSGERTDWHIAGGSSGGSAVGTLLGLGALCALSSTLYLLFYFVLVFQCVFVALCTIMMFSFSFSFHQELFTASLVYIVHYT